MITALLMQGHKQRSKLDKIRAEIASVEGEIEDIAVAQFPVDESLDRLLRQVDEKAALAETRLAYFTRPGDSPQLPDFDFGVFELIERRDRFVEHAKEMLERITPNPGLPTPERRAAVAKLKTKLRSLLVAEENEICKLESTGAVVDRRLVEPDILLTVWQELTSASNVKEK